MLLRDGGTPVQLSRESAEADCAAVLDGRCALLSTLFLPAVLVIAMQIFLATDAGEGLELMD